MLRGEGSRQGRRSPGPGAAVKSLKEICWGPLRVLNEEASVLLGCAIHDRETGPSKGEAWLCGDSL